MNHTEEEQSINLSEYYHVLIRHKWTIILSLLIMVSLVLWYNSHLIPFYRATTTLIIDREQTRSPLTGQRTDYESYLSETMTFNTHFKLITSRAVLEQVVKDLKLDYKDMSAMQLGGINPFRKLTSLFRKNISLLLRLEDKSSSPRARVTGLVMPLKRMVNIESMEDTRLLKINVRSISPKMAKDVANSLARAYINFNINNRLKSSQATLGWLTDHLYDMKKKLEDAEEEFLEYKQEMKLISPEESQRVIGQKVTEFNDAYIRARNRRLELDAKLAQLRGISESGKGVSHLRSLIENKLISDLYSQVVNAEVELSRLGKVYKSKHPKVTQVRTKIEKTRKKLHEEIKKELDNLKAERAVLLVKEKVLQKTMADFKDEAMETNRKELKYTILKRNVKTNQHLYDTLLSRMKETDITGNVDVSNIRITENAVLPGFPVGPNKTRNFMLVVIFGLMIGIGLSFLREYMDRTLRTEEDVEKYLGLPVLSVIPMADQAGGKSYGYGGRHRSTNRKKKEAKK